MILEEDKVYRFLHLERTDEWSEPLVFRNESAYDGRDYRGHFSRDQGPIRHLQWEELI